MYIIKAILILDNDGNRLVAKVSCYSLLLPDDVLLGVVNDQNCHEFTDTPEKQREFRDVLEVHKMFCVSLRNF